MPPRRPGLRIASLLAFALACVPPSRSTSEVQSGALAAVDPVAEVDTRIGTGGHGHTFPGPTLPFGMVQLGPDTRLSGWDGCSGYHHDDRVIHGFSHTHLSGTGVSDYGDVLLMPSIADEPTLEGQLGIAGYPRAAHFDHAQELAQPGYYAVTLQEPGIEVELTTTDRVGIHRYRFGPGRTPLVDLDLGHRDALIEARVEQIGPRELAGVRRSNAWARDQHVYFVARFSRDIVAIEPLAEHRSRLRFAVDDAPLLVRVGISAVDVAGARANLDAEAPHEDFERYRAAAQARWRAALGKIVIEGGSAEQRTTFYTALYHAMLAPNLYQDVDGRFRGRDLEVHADEGFTNYTVFSLWDTFRAAHPLLTLLEPARTQDFIATMLAHYRHGGRLPVWELAGNETDTMIGYHAVPVIVDAWVKGVRGFDAKLALEAMLHSATLDHLGLPAYRTHGYIPIEAEPESVSKTLEYAYDDWCIARFAAAQGEPTLAAGFDGYAQAWENLFDPSTGVMRPRSNGDWLSPFDPREVNVHYTEANAWQYGFFVPHDLGGLVAAHGGREALAARLDQLFAAPSETTGRTQVDITGLIGQYAHGNEPSHHIAYLYAYAGRADQTQRRVRQILDELYDASPDGLAGNEDCGQMSAWYVFSALGFYPVTPGSTTYVVGTPLFPRATIQLDNGKSVVIEAPQVSATNLYVQGMRVDGQPRNEARLDHAELLAGAHIEFDMGPTPNASWGTLALDEPLSRRPTARLPTPLLSPTPRTFSGRIEVTASGPPAAELHYTLDGTLPGRASPRLVAPIGLDDSAIVQVVAIAGDRFSGVARAQLHRRLHEWPVALRYTYNRQYHAGGPSGLVDGLRGTANWRLGDWQGYQGTDFEATVDLGQIRKLSRVSSGYLQDARAWIWMPVEVEVALSSDGEHFEVVGRVGHDVDDHDLDQVHLRELELRLRKGTKARYVRVRAKNYGTIPAWHPGAGSEAFVFVDEITIE
jgi:predicted alpha-1,2-mannosidase